MDRQHAHHLLDRLGETQFEAVARLLEVLAEPLSQTLSGVPVEDEEITEEMSTALDQARSSLRRGKSVSHEDILRELGVRG